MDEVNVKDLRSLIRKHVARPQDLRPMVMGRGWVFRVSPDKVNGTARTLWNVVPAGVDVEAQRNGTVYLCDHRTAGGET